MATNQSVAFISYSHDDNKNSQSGVRNLVEAIRLEYDLIAGESLSIFMDDTSIEWGQEWRSRIDGALTQTTFFIPIVTPRYFKRTECRREFIEFSSQAKSLGLEELVLPILYVDVQDMSTESPDEIIARVSRFQPADWRELRLIDMQSERCRQAVNSLATRLRQVSSQAADTQIARELTPAVSDDEYSGLGDILQKIEEIMPPWLDAVLSNKTTGAQMKATIFEYLDQCSRLRARRSPQSAIMATRLRLGPSLLPLLEKAQSEAYDYLRVSLRLDPWIIMAGRELRRHPEHGSMFRQVKDNLAEAIETIEVAEAQAKHDHGDGDHFVFDHVLEISHLSRTLSRVCAISRDQSKAAVGGNEIVRRWWNDLAPLIS